MTWSIAQRNTTNPSIIDDHLMKTIYTNRGVKAEDDLTYPLQGLHHFGELTHIERAAERLFKAFLDNENIMIIGDYDTDGATSTALMMKVLKALGYTRISFAVPDRFKYGYGLSEKLIKDIHPEKIDVIVTVDNGIASIGGVAYANKHDIDVIITDHHLPGEQLPDAYAIVNPNQKGDAFPSRNLAGVGVAFYVLLALRDYFKAHLPEHPLPNMKQYLDIVALGTIADLVPLDYNNRILVHHGTQIIKEQQASLGIQSLMAVANRQAIFFTASDFGFYIAPKLNAAGRLDDMSLGIQCLLSTDRKMAKFHATQLDQLNEARKQINQQMQMQALAIIASMKEVGNQPVIILYHQSWHEGVIGIVASKIKEAYHRPTFIFANNGDLLKGSARSIPGINLKDVLTLLADSRPQLMQGYGGHAMAAGLTIAETDFGAFKDALTGIIKKTFSEDLLHKVYHVDGMLADSLITLDQALKIEQGGPWGQGFEEPIFHGYFDVLESRSLSGDQHSAYTLRSATSDKRLEAIFFNQSAEPFKSIRHVEVVYQLKVNRFNHRKKLQLQILAMRAKS